MSVHLCLLGDANHVHLRRWAAAMLSRGFRVSVVTARPQAISGVEQRVLAPVRRRRDWLFRTAQAKREVADLAPDIVHAHYVTSYGYLGARCARQPLVLTAWGTDVLITPRQSWLLRRLTAWTLRRAALVTADSADALDAIARLCPGAPLQLVHWGADTAKFRPSDDTVAGGFRIVSLRLWETNYNVDIIVAAVAELIGRLPHIDIRLRLLGGGSLAGALRQQTEALGIAMRVEMLGRLDEAAMIDIMRGASVSVSVPTSDATSVSVLESMACGLPVVATDLPANRAWLGGQADLLVPPRDVRSLVAALEGLCRDLDRARTIGMLNRERMTLEGSRDAQMDRMAGLYERLVAETRGEARP